MEIAKLIVALIGELIWPTLILVLILMFYKEIKTRLSDLRELEFPGGFKAKLNETKILALSEETTEELIKIDKEDEINEAEKQKLKLELITEQFKRVTEQVELNSESKEKGEKKNIKNSTLIIFTANQSRKENLKYNIYYDPVTRNHNSPFRYIGLYQNMKVFAIGKVTKRICCNLKNGELVATHGDNLQNLSDDEYKRIKEIIQTTDYFDLDEGLKFYLVDNFYTTNFIKGSDYPLRAKKYIWLDEIKGFNEDIDTQELAKLLEGKEWV